MARADYLFTSESVSEGHPDKVSDRVSDAVVDTFLAVIADGEDDGPADAAHTAAAHVRTLLAAGTVSKAA